MKFLDICTQVSIATTAYYVSEEEKEWLLGTDTLTASIQQVAIAHIALKQLSICFDAVGWKFLSSRKWAIISFSPLLVALAQNFLPPRSTDMKCRLVWTSFHCGDIGRALLVTSTIALVTLGKKKEAALCLTSYSLCYIENHDSVPESIQNTLSNVFQTFGLIAGLYEADGYIDYVLTRLELVALCEKFLAPYLYGTYTSLEKRETATLTLDEVQEINIDRYAIDATHFDKALFAAVDEDSYQEFTSKLDQLDKALSQIDWDSHIDSILLKLPYDDHWCHEHYVTPEVIERYQHYKNGSLDKTAIHADIIGYVKEGLQVLIQRIKRRTHVFAGLDLDHPALPLHVRKVATTDIGNISPEGFKKIQHITSALLTRIQQNPNSEQSIGVALTLGIDGASFCGPRIVDVFDLVFKHLFEHTYDASAITYQILRDKQMQYLYELMERETSYLPTVYRQVLGEHTPHRKNYYLKFYGEPIGLDTGTTCNDSTIGSSMGSSRLLWLWWVRRAKREFYTEYYTPENIVSWIRNQLEEGDRLPWVKFEEWFNQQGIEAQAICDESGHISATAIHFFLLKLGVFGFKA